MIDFHGRPASAGAALAYIDAGAGPADVRRGAAAAGRRRWACRGSRADSPCRSQPASGWSSRRRVRRARSGPAPSTSCSRTSAIAAGCWSQEDRRDGRDRWRSASRRTTRSGRSPASPRCISAISTHNVIIQEEMVGAVPVVLRRGPRADRGSTGRWQVRTRRASASRSTKPSSPRTRSSRRYCTPRTPSSPTARSSTGERCGGPPRGQGRHRHRSRPGHRRGDRPHVRRGGRRCVDRRAECGDRARRRGRDRNAGGRAAFVETDVADHGGSRGWSANADRSSAGRVLVNNAGTNVFHKPLETRDEEWRRCLASTWRRRGPARAQCCRRCWSRAGSIVNIASCHAFKIIPHTFPYPVAKHALVGLTRALGIEYAARGIRVNAIAPGYIETPIAVAYWAHVPRPRSRATAGRRAPPAPPDRPAGGGRVYGGVPRLRRGAVHQRRDDRHRWRPLGSLPRLADGTQQEETMKLLG